MTLQIKHWTSDMKLMKSKNRSLSRVPPVTDSSFPKGGGANSRGMRPGDIFTKNCMKTRMHSSRMRTVRSSSRLLGGVCLSACWDAHPPGPGPGPQPPTPPALGLDTLPGLGLDTSPARPPNLPPRPSTLPLDPTMYAIVLWCKEEKSLNLFAAIRFSRECKVKHLLWGMELRSIYTIEFLRLLFSYVS